MVVTNMKTQINLLFICTKNKLRSLTAEQIFKKDPRFSVRSAGTASDALRKITGADLNWADFIFVMEKKHQEIIQERFPTQSSGKKLICLDIPDEYPFMDEELVRILEESVSEYLKEG